MPRRKTVPMQVEEGETVDIQPRRVWIRPSGARLWAHPEGCPASMTFPDLPADQRVETVHTLRGTRLHEAVASIIDPRRPKPALEAGEWAEASLAVSEFERYCSVDRYDWKVEKKIAWHVPGGAYIDGTPDLVGYRKGADGSWRGERSYQTATPCLTIADWKFGAVPVSAADNYQLICYAVMLLWGEADLWCCAQEDDTVRVCIIQPAAEEKFTPMVDATVYSISELAAHRDRLIKLIEGTQDGARPIAYNPSDRNCRWCDAARSLSCPEVKGSLATAERTMTPDLTLAVSDWADFLRRADIVAVMAKHIRAAAQSRLEKGERLDGRKAPPPPGLKLVQGRAGHRKWTSESEAAKELVEWGDHGNVDIYAPMRLKSPAVLEKEFKALKAEKSGEIIRRHYERSEPTTTVAFADDVRDTVGDKRTEEVLQYFADRNQ